MDYNLNHFIVKFLEEMKYPTTEANVKALHAWQACEGSDAHFNPFDTTLWQPGATPYNTFYINHRPFHVWNYNSMESGIRATMETMREDYYPAIRRALHAGHGKIVSGAAREEMQTWGTNPDCIAHRLGG